MGNSKSRPADRKESNTTPRSLYFFNNKQQPSTTVLAPVRPRTICELPNSYNVYRDDLMRKKISHDELEKLSTRISRNADQLALKRQEDELHRINLDKIRTYSRFCTSREIPKPTPSILSLSSIRPHLQKIREHDFKFFPVKTVRPELTDKILVQIREALIPYPPNEALVEIDGGNLLRKDFQTLQGLNWLNDEIINAYMSLMVLRGRKSGYKKVYAFNTFFYPKLKDSGYSSIRRWTRKVDIFTYDFILVPVHLGNHWCLAFINFIDKTISYYDSLGGQVGGCCDRLLQYLKEESYDKKKQDFDGEVWKLIDAYSYSIPQQKNCSDCGVFACTYAEHLTRQAKLDFSQDDMPYFRKKMVYELITKEILE